MFAAYVPLMVFAAGAGLYAWTMYTRPSRSHPARPWGLALLLLGALSPIVYGFIQAAVAVMMGDPGEKATMLAKGISEMMNSAALAVLEAAALAALLLLVRLVRRRSV